MLFRSFEPSNLPFLASMLSIRIASMLFTCCFEASNLPIFHSRPVSYLYVLPVCYLHAVSKLRTTQSSIPGQYAIYTYCQYAIYMLFRSFEPSNLPFLASMLSIRIASMLFTCCFEASNHPIFHSWPVRYLYVLPVCYLHAVSKLRTIQSSIPGQYAIYTYCLYAIYMPFRSFEPPNLPFLASMLSIRIACMLFTCCFEASNHPIFHSRPVCYLYVLPVCYLHAVSKLRTTQSSIPGQYAIYTYCLYAIYMLFRSFEPPNLPFLASMLSLRIASMLFTCCFEASNHPIFHSWPVCYLYVLPVCYLHAVSKLRTTQSSIPGQYAIYTNCLYAIYMLFRSFEPPNLPFLASMLSIRIACMLFTCCFEASNHPIFHSWPVCYLYVLPVCYLHAVSKLRTTQSSIPGQYAIFTYCQYAIYMLFRSFKPSNQHLQKLLLAYSSQWQTNALSLFPLYIGEHDCVFFYYRMATCYTAVCVNLAMFVWSTNEVCACSKFKSLCCVDEILFRTHAMFMVGNSNYARLTQTAVVLIRCCICDIKGRSYTS